MGKLDELRNAAGANVAESMGRGVTRGAPTHGASPTAGPDRWARLERLPGAQRVPIDRITRDPSQPRESFDEVELAELTESIRARGVLQPIRVRWSEAEGMYVVIAGERRWRAARAAGRPDVPCVIHDGPLSESEILLDQLAENLIRLDLEPIESARAFKRLMDANGWSARRLAEELRIDHDKVNRAVRLLDLPESVQAAVAEGDLPPTSAYELSKLDDPDAQAELAARAVAEGLSRADIAAEVRGPARTKGRGGQAARSKAGRKVTSRTYRIAGGSRVTVENARGLDDGAILAALEAAAVQAREKLSSGTDAGQGGPLAA